MKDYSTRRLKILYIDRGLALAMLQGFRGVKSVALPVLDEVPEDVLICEIFYAPERRAFALVLEHPSFPLVPPGLMIPEIIRAVDAYELRLIPLPRPEAI